MVGINKKLVEEYYKNEWNSVVDKKTIGLLIELTCKAYHLDQPQNFAYIKEKEISRGQNLGQI